MGNIIDETSARQTGRSEFELEISEEWSHYFGVLGGYVVAGIARCATRVAPAGQRMRSVRAQYAAAPKPGPARVTTDLVHQGRALSALSARLVQDERPVISLTATFTTPNQDAPSFEHMTPPKPELDFDHAHPTHSPTDPLWVHSLQGRIYVADLDALLPKPEGREWIRFRDTRDFQQHAELTSDLCSLVTTDLLGYPAISHTLSDGWIAPTVDITVFLHGPVDAGGLYVCESFARAASAGAAYVESRVWSPEGPLLASAFQTMLYRPWSPR